MIKPLPAALAALSLAGCMGSQTGGEMPKPRHEGQCIAEPGQAFVGQRASGEVGAQLLAATGAATLRWVPPRTKVTMDFRPDRLTVSYDDDMVITKVSCT